MPAYRSERSQRRFDECENDFQTMLWRFWSGTLAGIYPEIFLDLLHFGYSFVLIKGDADVILILIINYK